MCTVHIFPVFWHVGVSARMLVFVGTFRVSYICPLFVTLSVRACVNFTLPTFLPSARELPTAYKRHKTGLLGQSCSVKVCVCLSVSVRISNCPSFPHSAWSYICERHFRFPTFPWSCFKKKDWENVVECIKEFQNVHISPASLDTTGLRALPVAHILRGH
jgi:hypothetical protein